MVAWHCTHTERQRARGLVVEADRRGCSSVTEDRKPETQADKGRG